LRAFETVLRTRNLTAAGRELEVTAAAVGQQIRTLENYLGRKLFERRCQTSYQYWLVHVEGRRLPRVQRKFVAWIEEVAQAFRHDLEVWI